MHDPVSRGFMTPKGTAPGEAVPGVSASPQVRGSLTARVSSRVLRGFLVITLAVLVLASILGAAYEPVRWRVAVLWNVALGRVVDLGLVETVRLMTPQGRYYLRGLLEKPSPYVVIRNPFMTPADSAAGETLFLTRCNICHGEGAHGSAPRLAKGVFNRGASDWAMYRNITRGIAGTGMLPQAVSEHQTWQIITYIRGISRGSGSTRPSWMAPPDQGPLPGLRPVDSTRLRRSRQTPEDWLTYSGAYDGWRYSGLKQITPATVKRLTVQWIFQTQSTEKVEASPIVADGVMFITDPPSAVVALDAQTGRQLWAYIRNVPPDVRMCCGQVNRGAAIAGTRLLVTTVDAHILALDAKTGTLLWDEVIADYTDGYSASGAPLIVGNLALVGVGGGEYGIRGFIDAYDVTTGKRAWRFYTVPGPGEPGHDTWSGESWKRGSAPTWLTGSYDPELRLVYWGVGNPGPNFDGEARKGDNLYSNSVVALDPATGSLRWHFQFTPHDQNDWDSAQIPVLVDREWGGRPRHLMYWANRNGFFYVLDRATGEFLLGRPFVRQTWADSLTSTGVPVRSPNSVPTPAGTPTYPSILGGTNWWSPAYSPVTGYLYVPVLEQGGVYHRESESYRYRPGELFTGSAHNNLPLEGGWTAIRAIDPRTGERAWDTRLQGRNGLLTNGVMATAGGVVFGSDGPDLVALDAARGTELWRFNTGGQIWAAPVAYLVGGTQIVSVAAGTSIMAFAVK